ncbi:hypothetical protein GOP47_0020293 [Adiantum capillus-veneris]|uniref:Uncharacterized protein n=1 Tax=Adiantum capillus-veneris TaxID=13818 RepID=A0A9D4UDN3_ADICA|nr:hypothetical protein GOP47_0020293 [Adiantum capillus-veneris]
MMHDINLVLSGEEEVSHWFSDLELYLLQSRICGDEAKLKALPLVLQGRDKAWFEGLKVANWQSILEIPSGLLKLFRSGRKPLVLQGRDKAWFEGLKVANRQSIREIPSGLLKLFRSGFLHGTWVSN